MAEPTITEPNSSTIDAIVKILADCQSILFITGAGVSADSGVPTYRGIGGLYNVDTTAEGFAIEEVLSAEMFARDPACLLYTSPSPRDRQKSRMPSSA